MTSWMPRSMQRAGAGLAATLVLAAAGPDALFALTPVDGGSVVGGTTVVIDASLGNQTDPHVSGDLAAYTDESFGVIRYYRFSTEENRAITTPSGSSDQLSDVFSDVNGSHISFARVTGFARACVVYDVSLGTTTQIGPDDSRAFATALGGDTVAFVGADDIKVGRISSPADPLVNLSASPYFDLGQAVSPAGNAVVWQSCTLVSCSVLKSTFDGVFWGAAVVVANAPMLNTSPDTDGVWVTYDSDRAGSDEGADIYFQPLDDQSLACGGETQLAIPGVQRNPSVKSGVIAFESAVPRVSSSDLFVYQISTNTLYQVTNTPTLDEQLSDLTVLPGGAIRVVWARHPETSSDNDILAQTFTLPPAPPADTTPPGVTIATPEHGAIYTKNQVVLADYACADEPGGSGIASCVGDVASGDPIDTASVGEHLFTVIGTDNACHQATLEHGYGVVFPVGSSAFSSPVDDLPTLNSVKAGQSVPVKFSLGGDQGLAIFAPGYPWSQQIACDSSAPVDGIEETITAGGTSLSYDAATGLYKYVWKTDASWSRTCRQLVLGLVDGTVRRANFMFR